MSDIAKKISRYFEQRQELYPGDFFEKPSVSIFQTTPDKHPQPEIQTKQPENNENTLITSGNPQAQVIFICTRPLKQDIESKKLISGEAGVLFDKILKAIDLSREDVYITPLRFVSHSGKLSEKSEVEIIDKLIDGNKPKVLVSLGDNAGNEILGQNYKIDDVHGQIFQYKNVPLVYSYHPELVRRNDQLKRPIWEDFKIIRDVISK